jgi:hypothetical protein
MIAVFAATMFAAQTTSANSASALCRRSLARKAGGEIATFSIDRSTVAGNSTTIFGRITVFIGMEQPAAGAASAHHLIRTGYSYRCQVRGGKVRKMTLSQ